MRAFLDPILLHLYISHPGAQGPLPPNYNHTPPTRTVYITAQFLPKKIQKTIEIEYKKSVF
jgi:hypothetical protein